MDGRRLNGMAAARRIRTLSPQSKIVFVTQESDADVVEEAFNIGAWGYIEKTNAGTDLLAAVDAVVEGRQFVSAALLEQRVTMQPLTVSAD